MSLRFAERVAVVTGAASGIGAATALRLAREGAAVVVADVDGAGATDVVQRITRTGGRAVACVVDITDADAVAAMIATATDAFGRLDVLHANATRGTMGRVHEMTLRDWETTLAVNLTGHFLAMRAALPVMLAQGRGAIVTMSSGAALAAEAGLGAYAAAKAGLIALTRNVAAEYGRHGIRANCICPGAIDTPPTRAFIRVVDGVQARMERATPMRRLGTADEVAALVCFLASDEASYVNGATYTVDGGASADASVGLLGVD